MLDRLIRILSLLVVCGAAAPGQQAADVDDGPYLFHRKNGSVVARWIEGGEVEEKTFRKGEAIALPRFAHLLGKSFAIRRHEPDAPIWKMPEKLLAISDVEGQYDRLSRFLEAHRIVGKSGKWAWGKGHLVCVGDFVDRGEKVTETLWLMLRLGREAAAAGGRVHFLIGNHEAMVLKGDVRYTASKYTDGAKLLGLEGKKLYGPDTELGRWLRTRNSIVRIGDMVFVHAGVSPELMARKLTLEEINDGVRDVLGKTGKERDNPEGGWLERNRKGPLWYRGYFPQHADKYGPRPDGKAIEKILRGLKARTIVIGHTKVKEVEALYGGRQVIDIDTTWTGDEKVRGLLARKGKLYLLDIRGKKKEFEFKKPRR